MGDIPVDALMPVSVFWVRARLPALTYRDNDNVSRFISDGDRVTPITDINGLGHGDTGTDTYGALSVLSDSAGHFDRLLQADAQPGVIGRQIHYGVIKLLST
jgi:hypothetical protein